MENTEQVGSSTTETNTTIKSSKEQAKGGLPTREKDERAAQYLKRLQETGEYLFHGSPHGNIQQLEPRQASDLSGETGVNDIAVYATNKASIAIQRAIIPKRENIEGKWSIAGGTNPNNPQEPLLQITDNVKLESGTVYVLPKDGFEYIEEWRQWKNGNPVKPLGAVEVTPDDYYELGGKVEIINTSSQPIPQAG